MKNRVLRIFVVTLMTAWPMLVHANWVAKGRDAMFAMYLPQAKKPQTHAIFIISYEKRWSCRPAVSLLLMSGKTLGAPERQEVTKKRDDQLSIVVDGKSFAAETKITSYSNGIEFAMFAPNGLVEAMRQKGLRSVIARVGFKLGEFNFSGGTGFAAANATALANCS